MEKRFIVGIVAVLLLVSLLYVVFKEDPVAPGISIQVDASNPPGPPSLDSNVQVGETKEFDLIARRFEFIPGTIEVNEGDKLILHITSEDVDHGFSLPSFGVSKVIPVGKTVDIEFIADKKGEYPFFCNVACGSGHGNMQGKLVVN